MSDNPVLTRTSGAQAWKVQMNERAQGMLRAAAMSINSGVNKYACTALWITYCNSPAQHHYAAHNIAKRALDLFQPGELPVSSPEGWFGRPSPKTRRERVLALLLAAETIE